MLIVYLFKYISLSMKIWRFIFETIIAKFDLFGYVKPTLLTVHYILRFSSLESLHQLHREKFKIYNTT